MTTLFDLPEETPAWKQLAQEHDIETLPPREPSEDDKGCEQWTAKSQALYYYAFGSTEREAVVALLHELKLPGWDRVSINP